MEKDPTDDRSVNRTGIHSPSIQSETELKTIDGASAKDPRTMTSTANAAAAGCPQDTQDHVTGCDIVADDHQDDLPTPTVDATDPPTPAAIQDDPPTLKEIRDDPQTPAKTSNARQTPPEVIPSAPDMARSAAASADETVRRHLTTPSPDSNADDQPPGSV